VYSDENCIQVCGPRRPFKSRVCSSKLAFSDENIKDCSKEEFEGENFREYQGNYNFILSGAEKTA
jgi:hypothetical protein